MRYILIIALFLGIIGCTHTRRAGSFYQPNIVKNIHLQNKNQTESVREIGKAVHHYHSALGSYCTKYRDVLKNNNQIICDNGTHKTQIRILQ